MNVLVLGNCTGLSLFAQLGSPPNFNYNIDVSITQNDTSIIMTIEQPYDQYGRQWYIGLYNNNSISTTVSINPIDIVCPSSNYFGNNCEQSKFNLIIELN